MVARWVTIASEQLIGANRLMGPIGDDFGFMMSNFSTILVMADVLFFHKLGEALWVLFWHTCLVSDFELLWHLPVLNIDAAILFLSRALSLLNLLKELLMINGWFLGRTCGLHFSYWNIGSLMVGAIGSGCFETMALTVSILAEIVGSAAHELLPFRH